MASRKKQQEEQENSERWLLTYCDLITLLLAFFVVMYSMSQVDAKKFGSMSIHLRSILTGQMGVLKDAPSIAGKAEFGNIAMVQAIDLQLFGETITRAVKNKGLQKKVAFAMDERGLVVRVMDSALFELGKANLTPEAQSMLDQLVPHLLRVPNPVRVEGHTDNAPIKTALYPSNWELSAARATSVVRYLVEKHDISPLRVSATGYGEFRPIASNDSVASRAKNRRIDLVILSAKNAMEEPSAVNIPEPKEADEEAEEEAEDR
jgi:chemotaxis protein MotB